ncbi:MAG: PEP-CTERM sorting domain-containing protein [Armatimonadetes bacterium]|nr:PEP-CTERM sorting domain-containing protein [Armatimonadota bacterium]
MNRFLALGAVALVGASAQATLVLHYGFNDQSSAAALFTASTNTVSGALSTSFNAPTFPITGSSVNGSYFSFTGTTNNDQGNGATFDLAVVGTNGNNGTLTLNYNASLLSNQVLRQATRRSGTGFNDVDIDYSIDGGSSWNSIVANFNANTVGYGDPASLVTLALPTALDGQANVAIRWTFNGATSASANFRTDNITLDADVVPEPATMILLAGAAALAARRRKA